MTDVDCDAACASVRGYIGARMSDDLPVKGKGVCGIVNLDNLHGESENMHRGTHWIAFHGNNVMDPLGSLNLPPPELITFMRKHGHKRPNINTKIVQPIDSGICGHMSCAYLLMRDAGVSHKEIMDTMNDQELIGSGLYQKVANFVGKTVNPKEHSPMFSDETHIPNFNFCGPGTRLKERLERGDKPVNATDEVCMQHDKDYSTSKTPQDKRRADEKALAAWLALRGKSNTRGSELVTKVFQSKRLLEDKAPKVARWLLGSNFASG